MQKDNHIFLTLNQVSWKKSFTALQRPTYKKESCEKIFFCSSKNPLAYLGLRADTLKYPLGHREHKYGWRRRREEKIENFSIFWGSLRPRRHVKEWEIGWGKLSPRFLSAVLKDKVCLPFYKLLGYLLQLKSNGNGIDLMPLFW